MADDLQSASSSPSKSPVLPSRSERLQAALDLAKEGYKVVPMSDKRKGSWLDDWPSEASTSAATIKRWFRDNPNSNVGIVTGDGLAVLDVDPRNGGEESLVKLQEKVGAVPTTVYAIS